MMSGELVKDDRVGEGLAQPPRVAYDRSVTVTPDRRRGHAQIQIVELRGGKLRRADELQHDMSYKLGPRTPRVHEPASFSFFPSSTLPEHT